MKNVIPLKFPAAEDKNTSVEAAVTKQFSVKLNTSPDEHFTLNNFHRDCSSLRISTMPEQSWGYRLPTQEA